MALTDEDQALLGILELANERGKFAVPMTARLCASCVPAFERGLEEDLYRLLDVTPFCAALPGQVVKVFKLTDVGWYRMKVLREAAKPGEAVIQ